MDNRPKQSQKIEEGFPGQKMIVLSPDRISRIEENSLSGNLYPTAIGYYPHASFHERNRKSGTEQYILLYCTSGEGWIELNGEKFVLTANTYFILPRQTPHSYGSSQKDPWSIYWIHFTGVTADLLYSRFSPLPKSSPSIPYDADNINLFNTIFSLLENELNVREMELLYIRLLQFLALFVYVHDVSVKEDGDRISASISFMKENLGKNFLIKEMASQANYSVSRFSELFRAKTGYAPLQYFLQLKIQKSCQYLYFTKMNIKEICKEIGFEDQYYFSRMFKKQMQLSPIQYRKKYRT